MKITVAPEAATYSRACKQCGTPLTARRRQARYCGDICSKRARRGLPAAQETRTSPDCVGPASEPVSGFLGRPTGLLSGIEAGEAPQFIQSDHTGRIFPRTSAEHGLPFPDYLRARAAEAQETRTSLKA